MTRDEHNGSDLQIDQSNILLHRSNVNKTKPREPPSVVSANVINGNGNMMTMSPPTKATRASSSHKRGGASSRTASVSGIGVIREPSNNLAKGSGSKYSVYGSIAAKEGKKRSSLLMM